MVWMARPRSVIGTLHSNRDILVEREDFLMSSPESVQIRSYLLAHKAARQGAPQPSLAEQRADYELLIENYIGHPVPLPEGTRVEAVDVDGIPAEWIRPPDADAERVVLYLHGGGISLVRSSRIVIWSPIWRLRLGFGVCCLSIVWLLNTFFLPPLTMP
jgi:acetyl esterase/lipase